MESMELAEHASLVMTSLDEAINSLDNVDYFIEYLHSIGKLHHKVPGFKKENFWVYLTTHHLYILSSCFQLLPPLLIS